MRAVLVFVLFSSLAACGPPVPHTTTPSVTAASGVHQCSVPKDIARPMLVEWPATEKAALHTAAQESVVVVRYDGCRLKMLSRCTLDGAYEFIETPRAKDGFTIRDKTELFAKLPLGAVKLEGELSHGNSLSLSYVAVGTRNAQVGDVTGNMLSGSCEGATHIVRSMVVGAYELSSGKSTSAAAGVGVGTAGAGGSHAKDSQVLKSDGNLTICSDDATPAGDKRCQAIVQLVLDPIAGPGAVPVIAPAVGATQPTQPAGPPAAVAGAPSTTLSVMLEDPVEGATVSIDGQPVGDVPWNGPISPGSHVVKVEAPGHRPSTETVDVFPDRANSLMFDLTPDRFEPAKFVIGAAWSGMWGKVNEIDSKWSGDAEEFELELDEYSGHEWMLQLGLPFGSGIVAWEVGLYAGIGREVVSGEGNRSDESSSIGFGKDYKNIYVPGRLYIRIGGPVVGPYFHWGIEGQLGGSTLGAAEYGADAAIYAGFSVMAGERVEIRINAAGFRYSFKHWDNLKAEEEVIAYQCDLAYMAYSASAGFLIRL